MATLAALTPPLAAPDTVLPMVFTLIGLVARPARDAVGVLALRCTRTAGFSLRLLTLRAATCAALT